MDDNTLTVWAHMSVNAAIMIVGLALASYLGDRIGKAIKKWLDK